MQLQDLMQAEELQVYKDALGNDFAPNVAVAYDQYQSSIPQGGFMPDKQMWIRYAVEFLEQVLQERMDKASKTKAGKVTRVLWRVAKFLGLIGKAKQEIYKKTNKL